MSQTSTLVSQHVKILKDITVMLLNPSMVKPEDVATPCFWQVAKSNQLLLAVGRATVAQFGESVIPPEFLERYLHLEEMNRHTTTVMAELLPALAQRNLPILTIKSFLPFSYVDSNVDVVTVNPAQADAYVRCLTDLGYRHQFNLADLREPYKKAYGKLSWDEANKPFPKVHLHRAISWNGLDYLNLKAVVSRAQTWTQNELQIPVPSADDELLIMAAHAFFENKYISLHELFYLTHLIPQITDWPGLFAQAADYHWEPVLRTFLALALALTEAVGLSLHLPETIIPAEDLQIRLPYLLPVSLTFAYSWQKIGRDVGNGRLRTLPRQLFSYSFVDAAWMYRKAWRKQRKVRSC